MYSYEYVRVEGGDPDQLMEAINDYGGKGYRLCRWYENADKGIFVAIMEKSQR